jgi:1-deoxy-D-xylulose-5-phosphate reductoisomerase
VTVQSVTVLGATGSVGRSTLDVIARSNGRFEVDALAAGSNAVALAELAIRHRARLAVVADERALPALREALAGTGIASAAGPSGLEEAALRPAAIVMAAIVGAAGLAPTLAAIRRGATIALANKECLVCAGEIVMRAAERHRARIVPVDSEHNAIFQALHGRVTPGVEKLILTASGGPFRDRSRAEMANVTAAQALRHPTWSMGPKISIDSATMMNKGLELIEAHHLFQMPEPRLEVVIHPQSVVHSLVAFRDGSLLAQLGAADMRIPIACALAWPDRIEIATDRLDLAGLARLDFQAPDEDRFPALRVARRALRQGGAAPTILNAANEAAVAAFLAGRIGFLEIVATVTEVLERTTVAAPAAVEDVLEIDKAARRMAAAVMAERGAAMPGPDEHER